MLFISLDFGFLNEPVNIENSLCIFNFNQKTAIRNEVFEERFVFSQHNLIDRKG